MAANLRLTYLTGWDACFTRAIHKYSVFSPNFLFERNSFNWRRSGSFGWRFFVIAVQADYLKTPNWIGIIVYAHLWTTEMEQTSASGTSGFVAGAGADWLLLQLNSNIWNTSTQHSYKHYIIHKWIPKNRIQCRGLMGLKNQTCTSTNRTGNALGIGLE